jgi:hypothetical protein
MNHGKGIGFIVGLIIGLLINIAGFFAFDWILMEQVCLAVLCSGGSVTWSGILLAEILP